MNEHSVSSTEIVIRAPAKVNLFIRVQGRLFNNYHQLWSLMHTVGVFDDLRIRLNEHHHHISLVCKNGDLPQDRDNLVYRAAELVLQRFEKPMGVDIELVKNIPVAAGLGGGSSDAAATIYGLAQLLHLNWGSSEFCETGGELGSDIPFFFLAPSALVRGWGQKVEACTLTGENRWAVLVNPGFPIQTKWAYEALASNRISVPPLSRFSETLEQQLSVSWDEVVDAMENDFESAIFRMFPILGFIKDKLLSLGAQASLLSGSGATVFGIFLTQDEAQEASFQLKRDTQWQVFDAPMGSTALPHDPIPYVAAMT